MRAEEVTVQVLLGGVLLFLVAVTIGVLANAGVKLYLIIMWAAILLLFGLATGAVLGMLPKHWAGRLFVAGLLVTAVAVILQARILPVCGDDICSAGECRKCAKDCSPSDCANGVCELAVENCKSNDCACVPSNACAPGRAGTDAKGCGPIRCGDGFCDPGEGPTNCCNDCGCNPEYKCTNNVCFFEVPRLSFTPYQLTNTVSAASLAGNPNLTDANGNPRWLMMAQVRSTKTVQDVRVTYAIPGVLSNTVPVGTIYAEQEANAYWYVIPDPRLMDVAEDLRTNVTITLAYRDALGNNYSMNRSFPFMLLSANTLDGFGHIVLFTERVSTNGRTAREIWAELGEKVAVQPRSGSRVQFPHETLAKGAGAQQDIAVLLASAFDTAGLRTFLVESPDGYFVRVWDKDRFAILDPSLLGEDFDRAISFTPGYGVYAINQTIDARNFTRIS